MISNAISVSTSSKWYFFTSLMNRDKTYEKMMLLRQAVIDEKENYDDENSKEEVENGNASVCSSSESEESEVEEQAIIPVKQRRKSSCIDRGKGQVQYFWYAIGAVLFACWVSLYRVHRMLESVERSGDADFEMLRSMMRAGKGVLEV
jgi:hypothetical protein